MHSSVSGAVFIIMIYVVDLTLEKMRKKKAAYGLVFPFGSLLSLSDFGVQSPLSGAARFGLAAICRTARQKNSRRSIDGGQFQSSVSAETITRPPT